jgi:DNA-binding transcriptional MerR regulator/methylmalonyl-CoA mutase cobalamin-binding subunit
MFLLKHLLLNPILLGLILPDRFPTASRVDSSLIWTHINENIGKNAVADGQYNVKAVCRLTGLNEHTLRSWERRYQAITPDRQENRRRLYSREDVERLRLLVRLVEHGYAIGQVAPLGDQELKGLVTQHEAMDQSYQKTANTQLDHFNPAIREEAEGRTQAIIKSLQVFDLEKLQVELDQARLEYSSKDLLLQIILPVMVQVGHLVFNNQMDIGHEHALTALIRAHLLDIFFQTRRIQAYRQTQQNFQKRTVVVSTPEGDLHEIGILIASIFCTEAGLNIAYIGPNMPPDALARVTQELRADALMVGLSPLPPGITPQTPAEYLQDLGENLPLNCCLWLGGNVPPESELLAIKQPLKTFRSMSDLITHLSEYRKTPNLGGMS